MVSKKRRLPAFLDSLVSLMRIARRLLVLHVSCIHSVPGREKMGAEERCGGGEGGRTWFQLRLKLFVYMTRTQSQDFHI